MFHLIKKLFILSLAEETQTVEAGCYRLADPNLELKSPSPFIESSFSFDNEHSPFPWQMPGKEIRPPDSSPQSYCSYSSPPLS